MSIASEIIRIKGKVVDSFTACEAKGATMPESEVIANLPTCIESIPTGSQAVLGTKEITANGTYTAVDDSLDGYSEVTVDVQAEVVTGEVTLKSDGDVFIRGIESMPSKIIIYRINDYPPISSYGRGFAYFWNTTGDGSGGYYYTSDNGVAARWGDCKGEPIHTLTNGILIIKMPANYMRFVSGTYKYIIQ